MMIKTLGNLPPDGAVKLFDGTSLDGWIGLDGTAPKWSVKDGILQVEPGTGEMCTVERFRDHFLHLEFMLSDMPDAKGQEKSNSGVFVQGRYEVQVLDSSGWAVPGYGDCGAIYDMYAPLTNACLPALNWQSYDIVFRAPRCEGKIIKENARITVFHNGTLIHNNLELPRTTGYPSDNEVHLPGHLRLQDHGNIIWYRNIWAMHLPKEGASTYTPR